MTDSIPGAFYNEKGEWGGFDYDMATEVAKRMGVEIERVQVNNKTRIALVQSGQIDLSVSNMTHTRERDKSVDFSITYFFDGQKILSKKGQFKTIKDMVGKKIATMQGTTSEINVRRALKEAGDPNAEANVTTPPRPPASSNWWATSCPTNPTAWPCPRTIPPCATP